MINVILLSFILSTISCVRFQELPKYDYIDVIPNTYVYLDISSFDIGQSIYLEFSMDLFFSHSSKDNYTFQIGQVPAKSKDDYNYWKNLQTVVNKNYTNNYRVYNYSWVEIKQEGMNYIYMICPEPFDIYYTFWKNTILIENTGGLSAREIRRRVLTIVIPSLIVLIIGTVIIVSYCKYRKKNINYDNNENNGNMNYPPAFPVNNQAPLNPPSGNNPEMDYQKPIGPIFYPSGEPIN